MNIPDDADDWPPTPTHPTRAMRSVARGLAQAFLAAPTSDAPALRLKGKQALGRPWPWLPPLVATLRRDYGEQLTGLPLETLQQCILADIAFRRAFLDGIQHPRIRSWLPIRVQMQSAQPPLAALQLPALATPGDLADWLGISPTELAAFADADHWRPPSGPAPLEHYRHRWQAKRDGSHRLIEAPKPRLRALQQRVLHGLLDLVPPHPAAFGCVRGRSVVNNARLHAGQPLLIKLDLRDFFPAIRAGRIHALFRSLGYPPAVARCLTHLTTHRSPSHILSALPRAEFASPDEHLKQRRRATQYSEAHLPQGAPTSPALANLCAWRLDLRLAGAAAECGARYSRYVDDLAFSGPVSPAHGRRMLQMFQRIVCEEGFEPHWRKAGVFSAATTQHLTGVTINVHPNLPRREYDRLKAILTNCLSHGPASQNRAQHPDFRAHLQGRVAWAMALNPARSTRLQALFQRITWEDDTSSPS